jgi:branched-chain amino acid aminotransferase
VTETFEVHDDGLAATGSADSLNGASAALPSGAYTTLRTYGAHRVLRLDDHARRLEQSAAALGQPDVTIDGRRLRRALAAALRATGFPESRIRITAAAGRLFLSVEPFEALPDLLYRDGVACATVPVRRERPEAKDTRFISEATKAHTALPAGTHEGLLRADDGGLLEGLSSNFFALRNGTLQTEGTQALAGVTRSLVLELAQARVPVSLEAVHVAELPEVSECFLTSVSRGILPVVKIDGRSIGPGTPGPFTHQLAVDLDALALRDAEDIGRS